MEFKDLVGQEFGFYGICGNAFKLGRSIFEAVEDESDGMRSLLGGVEVKDPSGLIFFKRPVAKVKVVDADDELFEGYHLVDVVDGHVWLRLGTSNHDDWYPCFVFDYQPKAPTSA